MQVKTVCFRTLCVNHITECCQVECLLIMGRSDGIKQQPFNLITVLYISKLPYCAQLCISSGLSQSQLFSPWLMSLPGALAGQLEPHYVISPLPEGKPDLRSLTLSQNWEKILQVLDSCAWHVYTVTFSTCFWSKQVRAAHIRGEKNLHSDRKINGYPVAISCSLLLSGFCPDSLDSSHIRYVCYPYRRIPQNLLQLQHQLIMLCNRLNANEIHFAMSHCMTHFAMSLHQETIN